MCLTHTHLCTWCQSRVVVSGSVWSIRSWGLEDELPSPGSAAHAHLSSRGRRSRTARVSAACSKSAACLRLWNWRTPRSRCDAVTALRARPGMMGNPFYLLCKPATALEPKSAEPTSPEAPSPFLLQAQWTMIHMEVKENYCFLNCSLPHCSDPADVYPETPSWC